VTRTSSLSAAARGIALAALLGAAASTDSQAGYYNLAGFFAYVGPAAKLAFLTQPSSTATVDQSFATQPRVVIQDAKGRTVTAATGTVSLAAFTNSGCTSAAGGTLTASPTAASGGVATFSGVRYSAAATLYLKATSGSLTSACSSAVVVSAASAVTYDTAANGSANSSTTVSATISTAEANELLVASVACSYGCTDGSSINPTTISGGGLTWVEQPSGANIAYKVWTAQAPSALSSATLTVTATTAQDMALVVSSYKGVDSTGGAGLYTEQQASGGSTSGTNTLTTTRPNSLIAIGGGARTSTTTFTAAAGETLNGQVSSSTTSAAQSRENSVTAAQGTAVTSGYAFSPALSINYGVIFSLEVLAPLAAVSAPTFDQAYSADNNTGNSALMMNYSTAGPNELLLLAITYRSATAPISGTWFTDGPSWTSIASVTQGTQTTEVFRAFSATKLNNKYVQFPIPDSAKATAVIASFRGVNTSGTNGSGAIDVVTPGNNSTLNPSVNVTPATSNTLVVGILGSAWATAPTAGTGFTLRKTVSSTGGGSGGTKATTSVQTSNALGTSGTPVTVGFTQGAVDWSMINVVIK
jgi:hypothetical protein